MLQEVSIKMRPELRDRVAAYGEERRWNFSETMRVAAEQLTGADPAPIAQQRLPDPHDVAEPARDVAREHDGVHDDDVDADPPTSRSWLR